MNYFLLPQELSNLPPVLVIQYQGSYYSFGATLRSASGVWDEVKDKLDTLTKCDFNDSDIEELASCKYSFDPTF